MKVQFRRDKRGEILMSDTFNWDYNPSYERYMNTIKINGIEKDIESIIIEMTTIENAFNGLYDIVINGNYKLK